MLWRRSNSRNLILNSLSNIHREGEFVIKQYDDGDFLYVVDEG